MSRRARVPQALTNGPFTVKQARSHGANLRSSEWQHVGPATYVAPGVELTWRLKIQAANLRLPSGGAFSGQTAAWLHGLKVDPCNPIEITVPAGCKVSTRSGMRVRRRELDAGDVVKAQGFRATVPIWTVRELCARSSLTEAVVFADTALYGRLISTKQLSVAAEVSGVHGVRMLRRILEHVEPKAESPMEARLRMVAVLGGLSRPEAQVEIRDSFFGLIARVDLYYRKEKVAIEYDGATHKDSIAEDNQRQNRLLEVGVRLLRFTAVDVYQTPDLDVRTIKMALAA